MKGRRERRRAMKAEKAAMHKLEAEQRWVRELRIANGFDAEQFFGPLNFHRPAAAVIWNMPKRKVINSMFYPQAANIKVRRDMEMCRDMVREHLANVADDAAVERIRIAQEKAQADVDAATFLIAIAGITDEVIELAKAGNF